MPAAAFDYEDILDIIEDENCALFIGPGLLKDDNDILLENAMWQSIGALNNENDLIRSFYKDDGLILMHEENYRRRLVRKIRRFYEEDHSNPTDVLKKITSLPFPLIFNLTKHNLLGDIFEANNQPHHFDFYFKGHPYNSFIAPTAQKPLIYNLLGDLSEPESLILTHKDLFDYLESIFTGNSMSPELRKMIQDTDTFIFIGLPFEKWYMQLLLRVLYHISSRLEKIEQYASIPESKGVNQFFEDEFKIKFLPDDGATFIDQIYKVCEQEGILRKASEALDTKGVVEQLEEAKILISKNKIDKGLALIKEILRDNKPLTDEKINDFMVLLRDYNDLNMKVISDLADSDERKQFRKTIARMLPFIDDVKSLFS